MFWNKIKSNEYLELHERIERLRISFEALKIDLELTRNKLKSSKGMKIKEEEETEKNKSASVLLNPYGEQPANY